MAKTKKKTTASRKTNQRKSSTAKKPPKTKQSATRSAGKEITAGKKKTQPRKATNGKKTPGDTEVVIDRRRADRRTKSEPVAVDRRQLERRAKVTRRRQIDPTTCERDYSDDEVEFMNALDDYKRSSGRMFPTCSEILEVIRGLGYAKNSAPPEISADLPTGNETPMTNVVVTDVGDEHVVTSGEILA